MKQTTLFDFNVQKLNPISHTSELDTSIYPKLQKVIYKASKLDSDFILGFDTSLKDWIYPTNYPVRDYQLQITNQCLYKNTLVCLPTGLGKTFIATVVMFNFYRWYPNKKIVFAAPTRPLVRQQMNSASECVPINKNDIVEMTGSIAQNMRLSLWKDKRIFFLTAQVFVNDLISGACPVNDVIMVVLDEAHKATGNHSYCQALRLLSAGQRLFRVLGLSATPGSDIETIQAVIQNLLISHIELRTDECKDIQMYSHERLIEEIIVPLGDEVIAYRDRLYYICNPIIEGMKSLGVIKSHISVSTGSQFGFLKQKEEYRSSTNNASSKVLTDFGILISLYHAIELVQQHGLRPLFHFLSNALNTNSSMPHIYELMRNVDFMNLFKDLEIKFQSDVFIGGHPKLEKLKDIVKTHFEKYKNSSEGNSARQTRVMVFSQFRESVNEILKLLEQLQPLVRPVAFVGRAQNGSQKAQLTAMRQFISGSVNVLVSTCIGEEGLDVGEVDLIVCFDAQNSPIRLVQRLGRTGRKRAGRIVMLLSEGKEVNSYRNSQGKKSRIHSAIFEGYKHLMFYPDNPRLVPIGLEPSISFQKFKLERIHLPETVTKNSTSKKLKDTLHFSQVQKISVTVESPGHMRSFGETVGEHEIFTQRYNVKKNRRSLYQAQKTVRIGHSSLTEGVVSILKLKEMHCRGKTNMVFHLTNSRNLDIDEAMTQDPECSMSQHSLDSFSMSISDESNDCFVDLNLDEPVPENCVKPCLPQRAFEDLLANANCSVEELKSDTEEEMSFDEYSPFSSASNLKENNELSVITGESSQPKESIAMEDDIPLKKSEKDESEKLQGLSDGSDMFDIDWDLSPDQKDSIKENEDFKLEVEEEKISTDCCVQRKASTPIKNDKKTTLLNSFIFNKGQSIFASSFKGHTSTPIRKDQRKSLLSNFHNTEKENSKIGFDTALDLVDSKESIVCELSTDLFDDDYDEILSGNTKDEVVCDRSIKKQLNISAILSSFHVPSSNIHENMNVKRTDEQHIPNFGKVLDSDEDLFPDQDNFFSDEDEFEVFEKLTEVDKGENKGYSNSSDNFLNPTSTKDGSNLMQVGCLSFEVSSDIDDGGDRRLSDIGGSPSFESDSFIGNGGECKSKLLGSSLFESKSYIETEEKKNLNKSFGSPSFGSDSFLEGDELPKTKEHRSPLFDSKSFVRKRQDSESDSFIKAKDFKTVKEGKESHHLNPNKVKTAKRSRKKPSVRDYFLTQADTSGHKDDEEEDEDMDGMEDSFIDDEGSGEDEIEMDGIYVRSLLNAPAYGGERGLGMRSHRADIVDTQLTEDESYVCDSFVVADDYESPRHKRLSRNQAQDSQIPSKRFKRLEAFDDSMME